MHTLCCFHLICVVTYKPPQWDQTFLRGLVISIHLVEPMLIHLSVNTGIRLLSLICPPRPIQTEKGHVWDLTYLQVTKVTFSLETSVLNFVSLFLPSLGSTTTNQCVTTAKLWWHLLANPQNYMCTHPKSRSLIGTCLCWWHDFWDVQMKHKNLLPRYLSFKGPYSVECALSITQTTDVPWQWCSGS